MRRWIVNVFWRELGYPRLSLAETHCCLVATDADRASTARRLVSQVRANVAGHHRIRVRFTLHPHQPQEVTA